MKASHQLGPYRLTGSLGQGGMGTVYRAQHVTLGVERALKVIRGYADAKSLARFEREAAALAAVSHRNVVRVHDAGRADQTVYFAMELVEGRSLAARLEEGPLPLRRALDVAAQIARGVGALHQAGILHRDLKPDNVVLSPDGRPVVIDLGLAVAPERDERLTRTGAAVGTVCYMAPEQVRGADAGPRTDVYALGLILFELVTGQSVRPQDAPGYEVVAQILDGRIPLPSELDPGLPAALDALVAAATASEPSQRPADGDAFADAVEALARAPGPSARAARRRRWVPAVAGGALVLLAAAAAVRAAGGPAPETGAVEPGETSTQDRPTTPATRAAASEPAPALSAADERAARRERARLERLAGPTARLAAAEAWLERYRGHRLTSEVEALAKAARPSVPLASFQLEPDEAPADTDRANARRALWAGEGLLLLSTSRGHVSLRDARTGDLLQAWREPIFGATVLAERQTVVTSTQTGLRWYALHSGAEQGHTELDVGASALLAVPGSPNAVLVPSTAGTIQWFDLDAGRVVRELPTDLGYCHTLAVSPDGGWVAAGYPLDEADGDIGRVVLWEAATGREAERLDIPATPTALGLSPDGLVLAVGSNAYAIQLFQREGLQLLRDGTLNAADLWEDERFVNPLGGLGVAHIAHRSTVRGLQFVGDRLFSICGSDDHPDTGELREWALSGERPCVRHVRLPEATFGLDVGPQGIAVRVGRGDVLVFPPPEPAAAGD